MNTESINRFLNKTDKTLIGFIAGLILPMFMYYLLYLLKFSNNSWDDYIKVTSNFTMLPSIIWKCVFVNLPFILATNFLKKLNISWGLIIASMLYVISMTIIKFFL